jgi:predicted MPP superfamily phosphohydrolase
MNQTLNVARFVTPYVAGLYRLGGASCYVNSGLGTIAMPVRLGAPPEITLLRLTRAEGPANKPSTVGGSSMGARV